MSNVTYSPSHGQVGAPAINIQSTFRTPTNWCKNISLAVYLVATVIHIQSLRSHIRVCVYILYAIFFTIYRTWSGKRNTNFGIAVNAACEGNHSACHFGHACYRFINPDIGTTSEHVFHKTGLLLTHMYRNLP